MGITTLSSREFNQDRGRAKRALRDGPVIVTDRGKPSIVVLSYDEYRKILFREPSLAELLYDPVAAEIDFELPPRSKEISRKTPQF